MTDEAHQGSEPVDDKVSWGTTTYLGYGTAATAFVLAVVAFLGGDRDEQTLGVIVSGVIGGLAFGITSLGRYLQANSKIKVSAPERDRLLDALEAALAALERAERPQAVVSANNATVTTGDTPQPPPLAQPPETADPAIGKLEWAGVGDAPTVGGPAAALDGLDVDTSAHADTDGEPDADRVSGAELEEV